MAHPWEDQPPASASLMRSVTEVEVPPRGSTFRNSELAAVSSSGFNGLDASRRLTESGRGSVTGGSFRGTVTEMKLTAVEPQGSVPERKRDYKGRIRVCLHARLVVSLQTLQLTLMGFARSLRHGLASCCSS